MITKIRENRFFLTLFVTVLIIHQFIFLKSDSTNLKFTFSEITFFVFISNSFFGFFIFIVDDWNYPEVRNGTHKALKKLNIKIISKIEIKTTQNDKEPQLLKFHFGDWHNGYFVAVCQKQV